MQKKIVAILALLISHISFSCSKKTVIYQYFACDGGYITGETTQKAEYNTQLSEVTANPLFGYRFVKWSDGSTNQTRNDITGNNNADFYAFFDEIQICLNGLGNYYFNYPITRFVTSDIPLKAFKSNNKFVNWNYQGKNYTYDELKNELYNAILEKKIENDITVNATFEPLEFNQNKQYYTIAHAFGSNEFGETYTNSRDAFEHNYYLGQRNFEVDISYTTDNQIVCAHMPVICDYNTFMSANPNHMDLNDLQDLLLTYDDIRLQLDTYGIYYSECNYIDSIVTINNAFKNNPALFDRIEIELQELQQSSLLDLHTLFDNQIFVVTKIDKEENLKDIAYEMHENNINVMEIDVRPNYGNINWCSDYQKITDEYGIKTIAYTSNDLLQIYDLLSKGIISVMTDYIIV